MQEIPLGVLRVFPSVEGDGDARPGQWALRIEPDQDGKRRVDFFIEVASRLELLPVRFAPSFEARLRDKGPLCLVADTNALYHGTLAQALSVRSGRATHVAIADQAMMEMQRQREEGLASKAPRGPGTPNVDELQTAMDRWVRARRRATFLSAGGRTIRRLREAGHIIHVARPPAPMVRYLGGNRGGVDGDEGTADEVVGSNVLRDRLILEAAFQQRVELPGVPLVLVTDDARLAEQAHVERLEVGFGWLSKELRPPILTSPFIHPRTFQLMHVPLHEFLDELVWSCSTLTLQREGEGRILVGQAPEAPRDRVLAALGEEGHGVRWVEEIRNVTPWHLEVERADVPSKAPLAHQLLRILCSYVDGSADQRAQGGAIEHAYLHALGWLHSPSGTPQLTERGRHLASRWLALDVQNARDWSAWMLDAATDLNRLGPLDAILKQVEANPGVTDDELVRLTGQAKQNVKSQLQLASALGGAVRLSAKSWRAAAWTEVDAEEAVLTAIDKVVRHGEARVPAASAARVFTSLLGTRPMSLATFRRALEALRASGKIRASGSSPESSGVKLKVLVRSTSSAAVPVQEREIDLGDGDFLLPGTPCAVVTRTEANSEAKQAGDVSGEHR